MSKPLKVCVFVDPMASLNSSPEEEYEEIKEELTVHVFGNHPFTFKTEVRPQEIPPDTDLYVIDYGGAACQFGMGDHACAAYVRPLIKSIKDMPSTIFAVWSSFSRKYLIYEFQELTGPNAAGDYDDPEIPKNVVLYPELGVYRLTNEYKQLRELLGLAHDIL
jgi:hypothetical protein